MPARLGLLLSPQSCYSLLFKYLWSGTMAEIFAIARGVINMIQNGGCRRAIRKRSNWFFLHFAHLLYSKKANVQKTIKLERKGLLGF